MKISRVSLKVGVTICVLSTALLAKNSQAQDLFSSREGIALKNQVQHLSAEVQRLSSQRTGVSREVSVTEPAGGSGMSDLVAQLLERVATLENQNRNLRGELDQLSNDFHTQSEALAKKIDDMQFAAQGTALPSGQKAAAASRGSAGAPQLSSNESTQTLSAVELLHRGRASLKQHEYSDAQHDATRALRLAKTANGKLEAQFLLAQSLAGLKQYRESAVAYFDAYHRAPQTARAQEALLGVAASMLAMKDKNSACQALEKLHTDYPTPKERVKSAALYLTKRAGCH